MSLFEALDIVGSGTTAMQQWINADANNIANANDAVSPGATTYAEELAQFSPKATEADGVGGGVSVTVTASSAAPVLESNASSPLADSKGLVAYPAISVSDQLTQLMQAQDGYQGNADALSQAVAAYHAGLQIGS